MSTHAYVAFDLGAESGRAMLGMLAGERLTLKQAHRFANVPVHLPSGLHWNLTGLWSELVQGLTAARELAHQSNVVPESLGVDTWGVDFALLAKTGELLGLPFCYRDARHPPAKQALVAQLGEKAIYDATAIAFLPFNSLYQLHAYHTAEPRLLDIAQHLLFMPDLLHYFFSGKMANEATIASTSQMVTPTGATGQWAKPLLHAAQLPTHLLGKIVPAGTVLGPLRGDIAEQAGFAPGQQVDVTTPAAHDTASAVAAVPVDQTSVPPNESWAYLSSGTWSLMGVELGQPLITDAAREAGFTNERGVAGTIRLLKNIAGLWLVQEVRRDLARSGDVYDYAQLTAMAEEAQPFRTLVDPGFGPFASPGNMLEKMRDFARASDQPEPTKPGQYVRACLESLALTYRQSLDQIESLTGKRIAMLHIVGGGGQNQLLNQMTCDALDRPVIVGPHEATAMGNVLTQALGRGHVRDLAHLRKIVRNSFNLETCQPQQPAPWAAQRERFDQLVQWSVIAQQRHGQIV